MNLDLKDLLILLALFQGLNFLQLVVEFRLIKRELRRDISTLLSRKTHIKL